MGVEEGGQETRRGKSKSLDPTSTLAKIQSNLCYSLYGIIFKHIL